MKYKKIEHETYIEIQQNQGVILGISKEKQACLIERDGCLFKDVNRTGTLEPYKDWRLTPQERAIDLSKRLTIKEIAGLMLYSRHQTLTKHANKYAKLFGENTYDGKTFQESNANISDLTDQQKKFLKEDGVRHVLISTVDSKEDCVRWANNLQAYCESIGFGIPVNLCSDPRHGISADAEYNLGAGSDISKWPEELGLAASFDETIAYEFARVLAKEYRGLGITTALSPQIDLASDPRWKRFNGSFGESSALCTKFAQAYCDGAQTSFKEAEIKDGWGYDSVNTMVKHWPGGGSGEGGRDAHYAYGKYAVYPGDNFQEHLKPFVEGAFQLKGKTKTASAVMPYYTISYDQDQTYHENVGNSYSKYIVQDLLRDTYGYDGVVCTDWLVTADHGPTIQTFSGKCWGMESFSISQRHAKALEAGVDQFGGNNELEPVLQAYELLKQRHGEQATNERFQRSAQRILVNMFQLGLFDQPYVAIEKTKEIVGCDAFMKVGYEAQLKSIILLKNHNQLLPITYKKKVYIPNNQKKRRIDWFGNVLKEDTSFPVKEDLLLQYFELVEDPKDAEFAIVFMNSVVSDGYHEENGKGEYIPITLQYRPYTCMIGREKSIAYGDPLEQSDRSYLGKTAICENEHELDILQETKENMKGKPVICCLHMKRPCIVSEIDPLVDGLIIHFGIQHQALLDIISGRVEPTGLLPFQIPKDMETVELQKEDVPFDMDPYQDIDGNTYDFSYGRNFRGVIMDERVKRYSK